MAGIAIMGFGTVGSGVYEIIKSHDYLKKIGEKVEVKKILDVRDFNNHEDKKLFTKEFSDVLNDSSISVVAETIGGLHPAYEFTKELLMSGKSVVTSNKELVATYGTELMTLAKENNANYFFEASVGGGIPIIRPMITSLMQEKIKRIAGILNGTTNYILTQMFENGVSFEEALKEAQELGYAERNPAADVEGYDACRKIAILSSLAWGKFTDYNNITTEGITKISSEDVECAAKIGSVIKLIGYAECDDEDKVCAMVKPMVIKNSSPLSSVKDVNNAILVTGDSLGDAMFYGKGAGKLATASAVVADILDCINKAGIKEHNIAWEDAAFDFMKSPDNSKAQYMIRINADRDSICENFENAEFIDGISETAFICEKMSEKTLKEKISKYKEVKSVIRVLEA